MAYRFITDNLSISIHEISTVKILTNINVQLILNRSRYSYHITEQNKMLVPKVFVHF